MSRSIVIEPAVRSTHHGSCPALPALRTLDSRTCPVREHVRRGRRADLRGCSWEARHAERVLRAAVGHPERGGVDLVLPVTRAALVAKERHRAVVPEGCEDRLPREDHQALALARNARHPPELPGRRVRKPCGEQPRSIVREREQLQGRWHLRHDMGAQGGSVGDPHLAHLRVARHGPRAKSTLSPMARIPLDSTLHVGAPRRVKTCTVVSAVPCEPPQHVGPRTRPRREVHVPSRGRHVPDRPGGARGDHAQRNAVRALERSCCSRRSPGRTRAARRTPARSSPASPRPGTPAALAGSAPPRS